MLDIHKDIETILESIDGLLLIDEKERIVFMCKGLMDTIGVDSLEQIKGRRLRDVIASNNTYRVLETGERQIGETYLVQGYTIVSNAYPIYKNGKLIGALEYDVFEDIGLLEDFVKKLSSKKDISPYRVGDVLNTKKRQKYSLDRIKGSSNVIKKLKNEIKMASRSDSTVLITGETGSGKELIAKAVHMSGQRSIFEFVEVNCATIPTELFESELFGYEEGSFTGARRGGKKGLAELADKGTLFLDEVNTLPLQMQAKLLRFLQEKEIQKVGGEKPMHVNTRIIAATNENLQELVEKGEFRQDLYYRLNVFEIVAEPLRKRRSDIPELVNYFMEELNKSLGKNVAAAQIRAIENDALKMLLDYDWPGNVRELHNVIERAMNRCDGHVVKVEHFADFITKKSLADLNIGVDKLETLSLKELKHHVETLAIYELITNQDLSLSETAKRLGISRQMLHRKIRDYHIAVPRKNTHTVE